MRDKKRLKDSLACNRCFYTGGLDDLLDAKREYVSQRVDRLDEGIKFIDGMLDAHDFVFHLKIGEGASRSLGMLVYFGDRVAPNLSYEDRIKYLQEVRENLLFIRKDPLNCDQVHYDNASKFFHDFNDALFLDRISKKTLGGRYRKAS